MIISFSSPQRVEDRLRGLGHGGLILNRLQNAPGLVEVLQRLCLFVIDRKALFHDLGVIVVTVMGSDG